MNPDSEAYYQLYCSPEAMESFAAECRREDIEQAYAAGYWVTKDGRRIRPRKMGDPHLINTLRMLQRRGEVLRLRSLQIYMGPGPSGDMASMAFDEEADRAFRRTWRDYLPELILEALEVEAERRRLAWNPVLDEKTWALEHDMNILLKRRKKSA